MDVQPECDCMAVSDTPLIQDQGILIGDDIVAIDAATLEIIQKASPLPQSKAEGLEIPQGSDVLSALHGKDAWIQIKAAEELGLGRREYVLEQNWVSPYGSLGLPRNKSFSELASSEVNPTLRDIPHASE